MFAVNRLTGRLLWVTKVDRFIGSVITSSPVVYHGVAYLGIFSNEEGLATMPGYQCCVFRGALIALDARTGRILWKTYTALRGAMRAGIGRGGSEQGGADSGPGVHPSRVRRYAPYPDETDPAPVSAQERECHVRA